MGANGEGVGMPKFYKVLRKGRFACSASTGYRYPFPGHWTKKVPRPSLCARGYHVVTRGHVWEWYDHLPSVYEIWEVEVKGAHETSPTKSTYSQVRLIRKIPSPPYDVDISKYLKNEAARERRRQNR